jgi:ArsR family metal-binding transcriptional regulator
MVGVPALVLESEDYGALRARYDSSFTCSGWVGYRPSRLSVPDEPPTAFEQDVFGRAAVMVLARCMADGARLRLVAHLTGELSEALPYLNAEMPRACYSPGGPALSFMEGHRMVCVYSRRIAVAKADDLVDAWRCLESIRCRANAVWARRDRIQPFHGTRARPPALEIYNRLPKTNCGECGEKTCMAFALRLWGGEASPARCTPAFEGKFRHLKAALREICAALGVTEDDADAENDAGEAAV